VTLTLTPPQKKETESRTRLRKLPVEPKIALSVFVAVLMPLYLVHPNYGLRNFLYFCDIALLLTVVGVWLENRLLLSMQAIGILAIQSVWSFDYFGYYITGGCPFGMAAYAFHCSPLLHFLTLFHAWLPWFLVWTMYRLGYDRRAWGLQSLFAAVVSVITIYFCDPQWDINWSTSFRDLTVDGILAGRLPASLDSVFQTFHAYTEWRLSLGAEPARFLILVTGYLTIVFVLYLPAHLLFIRFFEKEGAGKG
jgi:hypothetical protein